MLKVDVPERISREAYVALIESLGLAVKDLRSLEFRMDGVYAEVYATGDDGRRIVAPNANELVRHRVYIPVVDGLE